MEIKGTIGQQEKMFGLIEQCKESGLSNREFCKQKSINEAKFYYWLKRYTHQSPKESNFIPIRLNPGQIICETLEIIYPNGVKIKLPYEISLSQIKMLIELC
jgi:hypothetical protein